MIPVLSREQIRAFDRHAIDVCKVPSLELMENAGRGATEVVARVAGAPPRRIAVVCGSGNNGGDGFVVARRLALLGYSVEVLFAADPAHLQGDAKTNHDAWIGIGGKVVDLAELATRGTVVRLLSDGARPPSDMAPRRTPSPRLGPIDAAFANADVLVDALLGTGIDRPVDGANAVVIDAMNRAAAPRVALDLPSGLDADTGRVLGTAVRATETVTFAHPKLGLFTPAAGPHVGRLTVADIGVPAALWEKVGASARITERADVTRLFPPRPGATHKATAGRVVVVAGSPGKTGAALLVARGALRAGAGLVTIAALPETARQLDQRVLEEMTARIDPARAEASLDEALAGAHAVVVGPGLGLDEAAKRITEHVVLSFPGPVVVDADALTHFAERPRQLIRAKGRLILTPHPGEMGRLLGLQAREVELDRFGSVRRAVEETGAVVLLKGPHTLIGAHRVLPVVTPTGSPVLATAGSGDVLAGIIAAIVCQIDPFEAAFAGAYLHGRAGDRWSERTGSDRGLLAHEIADEIPGAMAELRHSP